MAPPLNCRESLKLRRELANIAGVCDKSHLAHKGSFAKDRKQQPQSIALDLLKGIKNKAHAACARSKMIEHLLSQGFEVKKLLEM